MAVLYRAHYVTRAVEGVLLREKIPYTIYSGVPFFQPDGDQGCPFLSANARLPGRSVLSAHRQRAQAQLGQAADGFSGGIRGAAGLPSIPRLQECLDEPLFKGTRARSLCR